MHLTVVSRPTDHERDLYRLGLVFGRMVSKGLLTTEEIMARCDTDDERRIIADGMADTYRKITKESIGAVENDIKRMRLAYAL